MISVNQEYIEERECTFKDKRYRVRDNGAVMRLSSQGKKANKNDNNWTFGSLDSAGYLSISGVRIHQIVAAAFLGEKPQKELVIDHIDTIKVNNRPSNLRYVTRLENIVNNPLTKKKLEHATGLPIEKILEDISILHNLSLPPVFTWLKTVSQQEATSIREKLINITSKPINYQRGLSKTIINSNYAIQADGWIPKGEFPYCPNHENSSIDEYASKIKIGTPFFFNKFREYITQEFEISCDGKTLAVKCYDQDSVKKHILITTTYHSKKWFIHKCYRYFKEDGLVKYYTIALGKEWKGGNVFDDFCI